MCTYNLWMSAVWILYSKVSSRKYIYFEVSLQPPFPECNRNLEKVSAKLHFKAGMKTHNTTLIAQWWKRKSR